MLNADQQAEQKKFSCVADRMWTAIDTLTTRRLSWVVNRTAMRASQRIKRPQFCVCGWAGHGRVIPGTSMWSVASSYLELLIRSACRCHGPRSHGVPLGARQWWNCTSCTSSSCLLEVAGGLEVWRCSSGFQAHSPPGSWEEVLCLLAEELPPDPQKTYFIS